MLQLEIWPCIFLSNTLSVTIATKVLHRYLQAIEFDSPKALKQYLSEHPNADRSRHSVKPRGHKPKAEGKDLLKGLRDAKGEPEFNSKKVKEWREAHRGVSPKGSIIHGVQHADDEHPENARYVKEQVIPDLKSAAKAAKKAGKRVVFLAEGAKGGLEGSEQSRSLMP